VAIRASPTEAFRADKLATLTGKFFEGKELRLCAVLCIIVILQSHLLYFRDYNIV
jgi:hypothetical protein